jgi:hypothetical protein
LEHIGRAHETFDTRLETLSKTCAWKERIIRKTWKQENVLLGFAALALRRGRNKERKKKKRKKKLEAKVEEEEAEKTRRYR